MTRRAAFLVLALSVLVASRPDAQTRRQSAPSVSIGSLPASFAGTLPCADCPGIRDQINLLPDHAFHLSGRNADLVEIAGKRASLADLTRRLLALPGVIDAVALQLDELDSCGIRRIAALVVAPARSESSLLDDLRLAIDPVFLPRPLRLVTALPLLRLGPPRRTRDVHDASVPEAHEVPHGEPRPLLLVEAEVERLVRAALQGEHRHGCAAAPDGLAGAVLRRDRRRFFRCGRAGQSEYTAGLGPLAITRPGSS